LRTIKSNTMHKLIAFLFLIANIAVTHAQNQVVKMHAVVGDTVTQNEKRLYYLFPELPDSGFVYSVLHRLDNAYELVAVYENDTLFADIDSIQVAEFHQTIDKLNAFYSRNEQKPDGLSNLPGIGDSLKNVKQFDDRFLTPEVRMKMAKDGRRYQFLSDAADRQGLQGQQKQDFIKTNSYGEIWHKKKK